MVEKKTTITSNHPPDTSGQNEIESTSSYSVEGRTYIVKPVFKESSSETISSILMKLMQADGDKQ
ncbi:MAG: hypothetical protein RR879_05815 [Hydrogenoanaerobacterium sp.]